MKAGKGNERIRNAAAFVITCVLCGLLFSGIAALIFIDAAQPEQNDASGAPSEAPVQNAKATLLLGIEGQQRPRFVLITLDTADRSLGIAALPASLYAACGGRTDTLQSHLEYAGPAQAARSLTSALGITVDRYVWLSQQAFIQMIDRYGGIVVTLENPITYTGADGVKMQISKGKQRLVGSQANAVVQYEAWETQTGASDAVASVTAAFFTAFFSDPLQYASEEKFQQVAETAQTNLSMVDFINWQQRFADFAQKGVTLRQIRVAGEYAARGGKEVFLPFPF